MVFSEPSLSNMGQTVIPNSPNKLISSPQNRLPQPSSLKTSTENQKFGMKKGGKKLGHTVIPDHIMVKNQPKRGRNMTMETVSKTTHDEGSSTNDDQISCKSALF